MKGYPYPIVVVFWDDAIKHSDGAVAPRHNPARQVTIGWLLEYNDKGVSLAFEYSDDDQSWRDEAFIPAGMVVRVEQLDLV